MAETTQVTPAVNEEGAERTSSEPFAQVLGPNEAAIVETFVVPRYLCWFGELVTEMLLVSESARVAHLGCRTGHPDAELLAKMPNTVLVGLDPSEAALDLARNKAAALGAAHVEYRLQSGLPSDLPSEQFSHVVSLHPTGDRTRRGQLFAEFSRLLYRGGQALTALPVSGSFTEIIDLFREYALKSDDGALHRAIEASHARRLTIESLAEELEEAGLADIDFEIRSQTLGFDTGRSLVEDPVTRFCILPEIAAWLGVSDLAQATNYLVEAVDKYWSEDRFEVSVNVVAVSARKP